MEFTNANLSSIPLLPFMAITILFETKVLSIVMHLNVIQLPERHIYFNFMVNLVLWQFHSSYQYIWDHQYQISFKVPFIKYHAVEAESSQKCLKSFTWNGRARIISRTFLFLHSPTLFCWGMTAQEDLLMTPLSVSHEKITIKKEFSYCH